jgi:hypothetical protein
MTTLKNISSGWNWLADTLNGMINAINARSIIPSATIAVQESPSGVILTVTKPQDQSSGAPGAPGQPGAGQGGKWLTVTIVDPATCAQSQIQVWSRPKPVGS